MFPLKGWVLRCRDRRSRFLRLLQIRLLGFLAALAVAFNIGAAEVDARFPFFAYATEQAAPTMVTYTPSQLDPRQEANQRRLPTSSLRADLEAVRPAFDGLILYGYHEATTPRILSIAKDLGYRAIVLGIWDPKSKAEIDGVAELASEYIDDFTVAVLVGNEGITFKRYELEDLKIAADRLRRKLPQTVPIGTSEPLVGYKQDAVRSFGDFLAPNIHPVFDRPQLPAAEAALWAREQAAELAKEMQKPVILKETGFPHAGKDIYSPQTQAAFWSEYLKPGALMRPTNSNEAWVFYGVGFEAFDLPWKSEESKLEIEKSWGLMSPARQPYPAFEVWRSMTKTASPASKKS
jgi:exo-beta-1,3-glucanase (GH17 family)